MAGMLGRIFDYIFIPADVRGKTAPGGNLPETGALFINRDGGRIPEFARVMDSGTDGLGVSHVRFALSYRYQDREAFAGERTLALASFNARFAPVKEEPGRCPAPGIQKTDQG